MSITKTLKNNQVGDKTFIDHFSNKMAKKWLLPATFSSVIIVCILIESHVAFLVPYLPQYLFHYIVESLYRIMT